MNELVPLNLCIKYNPASIALFYKLLSKPDKKYMHAINVSELIKNGGNAQNLYDKLLLKEPVYLNPKIISRKQIIKLVQQLLDKLKPKEEIKVSPPETKVEENKNIQPPEKKEEPAKIEKQKGEKARAAYFKQLSIESVGNTNPELVTNLDDVLPEIVNEDIAPPKDGVANEENSKQDKIEEKNEEIKKQQEVPALKEEILFPPEDKLGKNNGEDSEKQDEPLNKAEMEELMKKRPDLRQMYEEMLLSKIFNIFFA